MSSAFEVVAEQSRRQILDLLRQGERPVGDLVDSLALSQPAVSKHLRVLRDAGLVDVRRDAQRRVYRLVPEPLVEIDDWLTPFREAWGRRLDALEARLDEMPDEMPDEMEPEEIEED
ncbi:MAG TPA: metalloregulator ArsR/SmtB family transcription factor [Acidimicrobiia bacterium]